MKSTKRLLLTLTLGWLAALMMPSSGSLCAQSTYKMAGPYEVIARDGQYRATKGGSERDMKQALTYALASKNAPTDKGKVDSACAIIDAYAQTLKGVDGHDAPLCTIQGYDLVRAMTIVRNLHPTAQTSPSGAWGASLEAWDDMVRRVWLPVLDKFEADSPYANGNWGAIVNRMRMACAIYLQDSVLYKAALDYFYHANDNGSLPNYISETGQCQETGRDQAHAQLGLEALAQTCEMAWEQDGSVKGIDHVDLWGALDNRMLKAFEYTAKYNLGYDVPFTQWTDCTGLYNDWTKPSEFNRGKLWDIYQLPYDHFHGRKGLDMPYTKMALEKTLQASLKGGCAEVKMKNAERIHQVFTYKAPEGAPLMDDYDVYVQPRGSKEWTKVDTYMAQVNAPTTPSQPTAPLQLPQGGEPLDRGQGHDLANVSKNSSPRGGREGAKGAKGVNTGHSRSKVSYAYFDFTGDVYVKVITKHKKFQTARVRPDYRGVICNVQNDSTVQFLLFQPENVSVEFDGNIRDNLHIFTSKPMQSLAEAKKEAKRQGRTFIHIPYGYYETPFQLTALLQLTAPLQLPRGGEPLDRGQGHDLTNVSKNSSPRGGREGADTIYVPSNTTVYVDPGTYIKGTFLFESVHDASIIARSVARPDRGYGGCLVWRSQNIRVDGLITNQLPTGGSDNVYIHDCRSISFPSWGDGMNVFASSHVTHDRVFVRSSDDCTTAYATRMGFSGNCTDVTMKNSTLWADVAHPIFIGLHGNAERGDTLENLRYENIDILNQTELQLDYQGCLAINCGDNNLVRNVTFDNIRIENIDRGCPIQLKVGYNGKYCKAPGRGIENVLFRNIRYYGTNLQQSMILGYTPERTVRNITFEGFKVNGKLIYDDMPTKPKWYKTADEANIYINDHIQNIKFTK